jgi:hypothetical protein
VAGRPTNNEELLQLAIRAARSGQTDGARVMLRQVYTNDRRNETAMLWLAKTARTQKERRQWLDRTLQVNPNNQAAQNALKRMTYRKAASENRTLLLFGAVAVVMIVVVIAIIVVVVVL